MALITCEHVCLGYDGQTVLRDVNFTVSRGDLLCVVGENGSGKSTLIKGLLGLKAPEQGSITLGDGLVRNEIGYLPQQTQLQRDFPASVAEVVRSGCINQMHGRPFYSRADRARAQENMERMGIEDRFVWTIVEGDSAWLDNGRPIALQGHKTTCGASLSTTLPTLGRSPEGGG